MMAEPETGDGLPETLFSTKPRMPPPPNVFTITVRLASYVAKLDDGSEQPVFKAVPIQ